MRRPLLALALFALAALPLRAAAQSTPPGDPNAVTPAGAPVKPQQDPQPPAASAGAPEDQLADPTPDSVGDLPDKNFWDGAGLVVSDGLIFHPAAEISTAYQTNVFYQSKDDPGGVIAAPILRLGVGGSLETVSPGRMDLEQPDGERASQKITFHADGNLTYNQYLSSNQSVQNESALGVGLALDLELNPEGAASLAIRDSFVRNVNPGASLVENLDRDRNQLDVIGSLRPGGGAIQIYAAYELVFDLFEEGLLDYHDRLLHNFQLGGKWAWLPQTSFEIEADLGIVQPADTSTHFGSTPLRLWAGVNTLLLPTVGVYVRGGYGMGMYSSGASFASYLAQVELRWAPETTMRFAVGYSHDFADALIGNDYVDHLLYARFSLQLAGRLQFRLHAEGRLRSYDAIADQPGLTLCGDASCGKFRNDVLGKVDASIEYQINPWLLGGVSYVLDDDATDFFVTGGSAGLRDNGAYFWNQVLVKVAARW